MKITEDELSQYRLRKYIVNKTFLSTTKERSIANEFAFDGGLRHNHDGEIIKVPTICIYTIIGHDRIALDIERISEYAHEKEVLIIPGQTFKVTAIRTNVQTAQGLCYEIELVEHRRENKTGQYQHE
ncbi:unnamed protein product [Didymodactylos carnosus]|uniref:Uncharacterized protein n=2 Tax=Didymodactylos carnosus TaxID=1234261 RepID=A0A816EZD2_9BILA|nr:unnamed protein product [Didymodactylos carnosus]CAF4594141.1 unnamed protein product [Didymodactylos carnosus]